MVKLIENFYIDADENNYILKQKVMRTKKDGTGEYESDDIYGYFSSINSAVLSLITTLNRKAIASDEILTLKECVKQINSIKNELSEYLK